MAYDCNLTMSNCQILNNTGTDNIGGLTVSHHESGYNAHLENITISENASPGGVGGLLIRDGSNVSMQSCVVVNNSSLTGGGGIRVWLPGANLQAGLQFDVDGNPTSKRSRFGGGSILINDCLVRDNITGGGGAGIYLESNSATLSDSTVCGNTPDQIIGAYTDGGGNTVSDECPPDCPDVDGDGMVGVNDVLAVVAAWGTADPDADVDGDGTVGTNDLLAVIGAWGPCE